MRIRGRGRIDRMWRKGRGSRGGVGRGRERTGGSS